eukprot:COSAG01_NODE_8386_length_2805_cov_5.632299_3_plen_33_part_01
MIAVWCAAPVELHIRLYKQAAKSPELNGLDLGF